MSFFKSFPKTLVFWLVIIAAIVWLFPKTTGLKFSNLDYRRSTGATRLAVDPAQAPWNAVGRLLVRNSKGKGDAICTAVLIAPNKIITARHCFINKSFFGNKPVAAGDVAFQLERGGKLETVSTLAKISYPDAEFLASLKGQGMQKTDYAFATLTTPVDVNKMRITLPALAAASPSAGQALSQAGYGVNREKLYGDVCAVIALSNSIVQHNCLITFGDSGGPIFYQQSGQWFLAGINSYYEEIGRLVQHAFAVGPENYYRPLQDFINQ
ncbi:MAG: trypsin-like serine protease [Hydrotalea sp.]|nr:trypsin-like serine protease [Hydrotalea sp.]